MSCAAKLPFRVVASLQDLWRLLKQPPPRSTLPFPFHVCLQLSLLTELKFCVDLILGACSKSVSCLEISFGAFLVDETEKGHLVHPFTHLPSFYLNCPPLPNRWNVALLARTSREDVSGFSLGSPHQLLIRMFRTRGRAPEESGLSRWDLFIYCPNHFTSD